MSVVIGLCANSMLHDIKDTVYEYVLVFSNILTRMLI